MLNGSLGNVTDSINSLCEADSGLVKATEAIIGDSREVVAEAAKDTGVADDLDGISGGASKLSGALSGAASDSDDIKSFIASLDALSKAKSDVSAAFQGSNSV